MQRTPVVRSPQRAERLSLRKLWKATIEEPIPPDMLRLLNDLQ